jgi:glycosyltransferase involved in cell wall biosynthesis
MIRAKNESRWIEEVIRSIMPLCERIYVMDDHSTDNTVAILESLRYVTVEKDLDRRHVEVVTVLPSPFTGLNESRDKNWLYDQILLECEPEWILCIDGDEVLEKNGPHLIRTRCGAAPYIDSFRLAIAFLWDSPNRWRTDRIYGDFWRPSLFRPFIPDPEKPDDLLVAKEFRFKATPFGRHVGSDQPNLHCSSVPQRRIHGSKMLPVRLKHYGYMDRADRVRKLDYYTSIDWKNEAEDCYRHMTQGDFPQVLELPKVQDLFHRGILNQADIDRILNVPPEATLLHAGPLKLEPWDESKPWQMSDWAKGQG